MFFAFGFFVVRRFCDDAKEASLKMPSGRQRQLKQVHAGLPNAYQAVSYQHVSSRINAYQEGRSDRACFSRTGASPPAATTGRTICLAAASAAPGTGACMTCMVRTVLTIHVRQAKVQLPRLPQSATKASVAKLLLHCHPNGATQKNSNVPEIQENTKKVARTEFGTVATKI